MIQRDIVCFWISSNLIPSISPDFFVFLFAVLFFCNPTNPPYFYPPICRPRMVLEWWKVRSWRTCWWISISSQCPMFWMKQLGLNTDADDASWWKLMSFIEMFFFLVINQFKNLLARKIIHEVEKKNKSSAVSRWLMKWIQVVWELWILMNSRLSCSWLLESKGCPVTEEIVGDHFCWNGFEDYWGWFLGLFQDLGEGRLQQERVWGLGQKMDEIWWDDVIVIFQDRFFRTYTPEVLTNSSPENPAPGSLEIPNLETMDFQVNRSNKTLGV